MIKKLDILIRTVPAEHSYKVHELPPHDMGMGHGAYSTECSVSLVDVANKLNEVIDHLNAKEQNGQTG